MYKYTYTIHIHIIYIYIYIYIYIVDTNAFRIIGALPSTKHSMDSLVVLLIYIACLKQSLQIGKIILLVHSKSEQLI